MRRGTDINFYFILIINFLPWVLPIFFLFNLQINQYAYSKEKIDSKFEITKTIIPKRGNIYVQDKFGNLYLIAGTKKVYDVYYNPSKARDFKKEIQEISKILGISFDDNLFQKRNVFLIAKEIDELIKEKLSSLKLDSLFFEEKYLRFYPENNFLSPVLGFASLDESNILEGKYGIEKFYNDVLKGEPGIYYGIKKIQADTPGSDLILSIDYFVQKQAEKILEEGIKITNAEGGIIAVLDINGRIIALAERPAYDLNEYYKVKDYRVYQTKFTQNYEPGSVMKAITYFIGLETNSFDPEEKYYDAGVVNVNGWNIYNFDKKGRGYITLREALEQSLNTGAIYVENKIGHYKFLNYLKRLKLNEKPYVDLPNLNEGNLRNLEKSSRDLRDVNFFTASFGHGIAISPAHLLMIFNTFANKGLMKNILIVDKIINPDGNIIKNKSIVITEIGREKSYQILNSLLNGVTERGSGKYAKTEGYSISGKTGSAYIPFENQPGYSNDVINTYVAYFPSKNPKFTILVRIDKPDQGLAMVTTVPLAKKIIDFLINYYNIQPDNL